MITECYYVHKEGVLIEPHIMEYPLYRLDNQNHIKLSYTIRQVYDDDDGEIYYYISDGSDFNFVDEHTALPLNPTEYTQINVLDYAVLADHYSDEEYAATYGSKEEELPF